MDQAPQDQELRNIIDKVCFKLDQSSIKWRSRGIGDIKSEYWSTEIHSICAENDFFLGNGNGNLLNLFKRKSNNGFLSK